ncbi:MAG: ribbon-helix-helix domain-containing protein [Anaerolineaceae bacterium]
MTKPRAKLGVFSKEEAPTEALTTTEKRTDRIGRVNMPFWVSGAAKKQLKIMAAEMDTTQQELMKIALNDLFKKHGKPPIA